MKDLIIVRGGGDIATGTAVKLYNAGFSVLILETSAPSARIFAAILPVATPRS